MIQLKKLYICRDHRAHRGLGLDESEFTKSVHHFFFFNTLLRLNIASVNNAVVTVLYLLRALHRRIIVYRILSTKDVHVGSHFQPPTTLNK